MRVPMAFSIAGVSLKLDFPANDCPCLNDFAEAVGATVNPDQNIQLAVIGRNPPFARLEPASVFEKRVRLPGRLAFSVQRE